VSVTRSPTLEAALPLRSAEPAAGGVARTAYEREALAALDGFDLLLTPTLGLVPPAADVDELAGRESIIRFTYPFNLLGWPALALPCGRAERGLPASAQLVGRPRAGRLRLGAGAWVEGRLH